MLIYILQLHQYFFLLVTLNVDGEDFTGGTYTATFQAGSTTASVSIPITNDSVLEGTESFNGSLSIPQAAADLKVTAGSADTATVNILDDDGRECTIFTPSACSTQPIMSLHCTAVTQSTFSKHYPDTLVSTLQLSL